MSVCLQIPACSLPFSSIGNLRAGSSTDHAHGSRFSEEDGILQWTDVQHFVIVTAYKESASMFFVCVPLGCSLTSSQDDGVVWVRQTSAVAHGCVLVCTSVSHDG